MINPSSLLAISLAVAPFPEEQQPSRFDSLASDPFSRGLIQELLVESGPPVRVLAQDVHGEVEGTRFVNVLRVADARPYRGKLFELELSVRLDAPSVDTTARLWVRVVRADGTVAFEDLGIDQATSSVEWTPLRSVGAMAADATDLCFGLLVSGTTTVYTDEFELTLLGEAPSSDVRHFVPDRWAKNPDVRCSTVLVPELEAHFQVTDFVPPGHALDDLPRLWIWSRRDVRQDFRIGRALLESMRLAQDPPVILSFVQRGREERSSSCAAEVLQALVSADVDRASTSTQVLASCPSTRPVRLLALIDGEQASSVPEEESSLFEGFLEGDDYLHAERVLLRLVRSLEDGDGDPDYAGLLFEASLASMEEWSATSGVQQTSHSLAGHECGPDCGHDHSHD